MEYKQVEQKSRYYEYGKGKEFPNEEAARTAIEVLKQQTNTKLALQRLYDITTTAILQEGNKFYLKVIFSIPAIF